MGAYVAWRGHQAKVARQAIIALQIQGNQLEGELAERLSTIDLMTNKAKDREVEIDTLRKKIAALPKPKPPVPLPPAPEAQMAYFKGYNLDPMVVPGAIGALAFPSPDLPIISGALQDSENLGSVSEQLSNTQLLVQELDGLGRMKDVQYQQAEKIQQTLKNSLTNKTEEVKQYQIQIVATEKKTKIEKILWGLAGIGVGVLVRSR
jgi:hypothetical protein